MTNTFIKKAFGTAANVYYPKLVFVGGVFLAVTEELPEAYEYLLEPSEEVLGSLLFVSQTKDGTVVMRVNESGEVELAVLSTTPAEGGTLNYSLPGGTPPTVVDDAIVVTFSENIAAVDTSLITLGTNLTPADLSGATFSIVGDTLTITGITSVPDGTTSFTLTIPVGAVAGSPSDAVLGADFVATYVGFFDDSVPF